MFTSQSETTGQSGFVVSKLAAGSENVMSVVINFESLTATLAAPRAGGRGSRSS
jgi:hypothetical protein